MTVPSNGGDAHGMRSGPLPSRAGPTPRFMNHFVRGRRRRWMLISLLSFWLALLTTVALPIATASADTNSLGAYGATAAGWAIQPNVVNDSFQNVPAADQASPYVFVSMDNTPGARAKASYFFPGTAVSAVPNTQGVSVNVPNGMESRFPGNGSASSQVASFNDGFATQASAGSQSARASEGYALAQAAVTNFQFAPALPSASQPSVPGVPGVPGVPTIPPVSSPPALGSPPPLPTVSGNGSTPGATTGATPTPTPTQCIIVCLPGASSPSHGGVAAAPQPTLLKQGFQPVALPDPVEQALTTALKAAEVANPNLLALSGGSMATTNPTLPYASADVSSQAETRATNDGVTVVVQTNLSNAQLFQGLITFTSIQSHLQAVAPGSAVNGSGTITTTITGASIAGIPVTIDPNGVTINSQNTSAAQLQSLSDQLNAALKQAGVHISLMQSVTSADIGKWQGAGAGVEVTADLDARTLNPPPPANGAPATHVDFSLGEVNASIFAQPADVVPTSPGTSGVGYGYNNPSSGSVCTVNGSSPSTPSSPAAPTQTPKFFGAFALPAGLHGLPLVSLVFVIQGLSTAVVAATAGFTSLKGAEETHAVEEETQ